MHEREHVEPRPGAWLAQDDFARIVRLTPLVSIDLIVRSPNNEVLLGRRTNEPAKNIFFVPGGRITKNETRAAAFVRLTRTELGRSFEVSQAKFLGVYDHLYPTNRLEEPGYGTHYVVLGYELCSPLDSSFLPRDQHTEYRWLTPDQILAATDVHENTKAYFRP